MSEAVTRGIRVEVLSLYSPEHSRVQDGQWVFQYTVRITNQSEDTVQLLSRHWLITDSDGKVVEVKGLGVVGHQPLLAPGEHFEYTSGSRIATPTGSMRGTYFCVAEDGERFEADIPEFALSMPRTLH